MLKIKLFRFKYILIIIILLISLFYSINKHKTNSISSVFDFYSLKNEVKSHRLLDNYILITKDIKVINNYINISSFLSLISKNDNSLEIIIKNNESNKILYSEKIKLLNNQKKYLYINKDFVIYDDVLKLRMEITSSSNSEFAIDSLIKNKEDKPNSYFILGTGLNNNFDWTNYYLQDNDDFSELYAIKAGMNYVDKIGTYDKEFGARPVSEETNCFEENDNTNRIGIFILFGQSLTTNTATGRLTTQKNILNFNPFDFKCYKAKDPLLGSSNEGGSQWIPFAESLLNNNYYDKVILIPIGVGGTYISDWIPGAYLHRRMILALNRINKKKLNPTAFFWQQGEAESGLKDYPKIIWEDSIIKIAKSIQQMGFNSPIFIARSTICGDNAINQDEIRNAQNEVINKHKLLRRGPDTDVINFSYRRDRCHFNEYGKFEAAKLWEEAFVNNIKP